MPHRAQILAIDPAGRLGLHGAPPSVGAPDVHVVHDEREAARVLEHMRYEAVCVVHDPARGIDAPKILARLSWRWPGLALAVLAPRAVARLAGARLVLAPGVSRHEVLVRLGALVQPQLPEDEQAHSAVTLAIGAERITKEMQYFLS